MTEVPIPKDKWTGKIGTMQLGAGAGSGGTRMDASIGGSTGMPFLSFDGSFPHRPLIAGEVLDDPTDIPEQVREHFGAVVNDVAKWSREWVEKHGADLICLRLLSTNPEEGNMTPEQAVEKVRQVISAVKVPLVIYGCGQEEKDAKVMEAISNAFPKERLLLGQAEEGTYKSLSAASMANDQGIIAFSNLDINLAKQITILLTDFGVKKENVVMDPLMASLGMGLEYSYSVNERIRIAALSGDAMLQRPMLCDCTSAWKCREATEEMPEWGDKRERGKWWEATTALAALLSGADILVLCHPGAAQIVRQALSGLRGD